MLCNASFIQSGTCSCFNRSKRSRPKKPLVSCLRSWALLYSVVPVDVRFTTNPESPPGEAKQSFSAHSFGASTLQDYHSWKLLNTIVIQDNEILHPVTKPRHRPTLQDSKSPSLNYDRISQVLLTLIQRFQSTTRPEPRRRRRRRPRRPGPWLWRPRPCCCSWACR